MAELYALTRPLVHCLSPETAHVLAIEALRLGLVPAAAPMVSPALMVNAFGLEFSNPVGLAAGFDKNAAAIDGLLAQGFGFVETGTVTPLPQPGNPKPRIFRLKEDRAVINRLGFNNDGLDVFVQNLKRRKRSGIVGANIGKNKDSPDAIADYVRGLQAVYVHADYITINISSPNTAGLRALQHRDALKGLLAALRDARDACAAADGKTKPLLLKVAPDLDEREREDIAELVISHGIDGLIVSNTTVSRPLLASEHKEQQGGLSGAPLFALSTERLRDFYRLTRGKIPLIGVGGIASAEDAYAKIRAGATLVQLYSALVYQGFSLVKNIQTGLIRLLEKDGLTHISQAIGADAK
jgi:dihydroorotate dehydrogenase